MARKHRPFDDSAWMNTASFDYYYRRLKEISISVFEWKNLPDTVDVRFMETALFEQGKSVFYLDENMNAFVALRCAENGDFNVYGVPVRRRAYGYNNYSAELTIDNSVIIYNNMIRTNAMDTCRLYAYRLHDLSRTIDINARAQKTPILLKGSEQQMLSLKNAYMQFDGNFPVMMMDKNMDLTEFTVLKTDAPFVAPQLKELHDAIWNEALTYLGVCNVAIEKKAQIAKDEVLRSQGGTFASRFSRLNARKQACELINNMFGLDIDVEFREGLSGEAAEEMEGGDPHI